VKSNHVIRNLDLTTSLRKTHDGGNPNPHCNWQCGWIHR